MIAFTVLVMCILGSMVAVIGGILLRGQSRSVFGATVTGGSLAVILVWLALEAWTHRYIRARGKLVEYPAPHAGGEPPPHPSASP